MREIVTLLFIVTVLLSCKKDKVPEPCTNVEFTGKQLSVVGTWRWYKTWVNQTFASGNTYLLEYTPDTEGFDYYCIITADGKYKGYRDSVLVDEFSLTSIAQDFDNGSGKYSLSGLKDCGDELLRMAVFSSDTTESELGLLGTPIYIDDPVQKKKSSYNFFKRD